VADEFEDVLDDLDLSTSGGVEVAADTIEV
jgi:hypothetical protein